MSDRASDQLAISSGSGGPGSTVVQVQGSLPTVIGPLPPLVGMGPSSTVDAWMPFTRTGSFTDPRAGATYTATVDYGDGRRAAQPLALAANNTFILSHAYAAPGVYTVTVGVTTSYGTGSSTLRRDRPATQSIYVLDATASGALAFRATRRSTFPARSSSIPARPGPSRPAAMRRSPARSSTSWEASRRRATPR